MVPLGNAINHTQNIVIWMLKLTRKEFKLYKSDDCSQRMKEDLCSFLFFFTPNDKPNNKEIFSWQDYHALGTEPGEAL